MSFRNGGEDYYRNNASQLTEQLYLAACKGVTSKVRKVDKNDDDDRETKDGCFEIMSLSISVSP